MSGSLTVPQRPLFAAVSGRSAQERSACNMWYVADDSGLAVQDPNQNKKKGPRGIVSDILSQAAK